MSVTLYGSVTLTAEVALSASTGTYAAWNAATWNSGLWGPDIVWTDVSARVRGFNCHRGFSRELQAWEAGSLSLILDNADGNLSADNPSSVYITAGVSQIRPGLPVRIRMAYAGVTRDVWRGYVTDFDEPDPTASGEMIVTLTCVDEFGRLAVDGVAQTPVGAGELSGLRIHRLLNSVGHTGVRVVDPGVFTMQATDLSSNVADELTLTAESEAGAVFVGPDGSVIFEDGYALVDNTRSNTVQATFGDSGTELEYTDIRPKHDETLLINVSALQRVGGAVQTAVDQASRDLYGPPDRRHSRTDLLCETDLQVAQLAAWEVVRFAQPEKRVEAITVEPLSDPANLWPQVLGRAVRDLIRVKRRPPNGSYTATYDVHIAGVSHQMTPDYWVTTFQLWSASAYQAIGRWDTATWDNAKWFF